MNFTVTLFAHGASDALFPLHASRPNPRCPVGRSIQAAVSGHYDQARLALEEDLERTTIADLLGRCATRS